MKHLNKIVISGLLFFTVFIVPQTLDMIHAINYCNTLSERFYSVVLTPSPNGVQCILDDEVRCHTEEKTPPVDVFRQNFIDQCIGHKLS